MKLVDIFFASLRSLRSNLLRSILTMLIVAIGISSLVGILSVIDNIIYANANSMSSLGTNSLSIRPLNNGRGRHKGKRGQKRKVITYDEAISFKKNYEFPSTVSISFSASRSVVIKYQDEKTHPNVSMYGVDENELKIYKTNLSDGRYFTAKEIDSGAPYIVVGQNIVNKLFNKKNKEALDKVVLVNNVKFRIIGIIESAGASATQNNDNKVYVPIMNLKNRYGTSKTNYGVAIKYDDPSMMAKGEESAIMVFRNIRKLKLNEANNFEFFRSDTMLEMLKDNMKNLKMGALFISIITLIGAAIALMNIMLVSVTDRIKEIGVRKSLGATKRNILVQFLIEALIICEAGGLLGIIFGVLMGIGVNSMLGGELNIPWFWINIGILMTTIVGLLSGIYPAYKASQLDPIESLRHE